jgi:hypothetical protein
MHNINPYNEEHCRAYCQQLDFYNQIKSDFDHLSWIKNFNHLISWTPREEYGTRYQRTRFSMVPFYYLEKLLEKNPKEIYDLGCGWNIFKKYIPNIIGVSPTQDVDNYADVHDLVDDDYIKGHENSFESIFSICALHFASLEDLEKIVTGFVSMIKPNGRGFLTLNLIRMIERSPADFLENSIGSTRTNHEYEQYVFGVLEKIKVDYLIVDVDFEQSTNDQMDGNIRLVFDKK